MRSSFLILLCLFAACSGDKQSVVTPDAAKTVQVTYAKGFRMFDAGDHIRLELIDVQDSARILDTYYLVRSGELTDVDASRIIHIPVQHVAALSTTHIGFLMKLQVENSLVGFGGTKYIYDAGIRSKSASGQIKEISSGDQLNTELLVAMQADVVFSYSTGNAAYDKQDKLSALQVHNVPIAEFMENTPLGQAEWIKVFAAFYDQLEKGEELFRHMEMEYDALTEMVAQSEKPDVFTGLPFKGEWTIPGGQSFAAQFLRDAGAHFIWSENEKTFNYPVSIETILHDALDAPFWLNADGAHAYSDILDIEPRCAYLTAFRNKMIYNNDRRVGPSGGNDYWESGVANPQHVLSDLIHIFHPGVLPDTTMYYYKRLE